MEAVPHHRASWLPGGALKVLNHHRSQFNLHRYHKHRDRPDSRSWNLQQVKLGSRIHRVPGKWLRPLQGDEGILIPLPNDI